jgi:rod shape-determining protein MreB
MATIDIGIDLGTANTVITLGKRGVVLSEPSAVAYDTRSLEILAVGSEAYDMIGKTPDYIKVVRPLSNGVISDDRMTQYMIQELITRVTGRRLIKPRMIICVPSFITDVEKRAVVEAAMSAGSRKVYLIDEPIAALIGAGVNISLATGNMIVDIGGGTTDVAIVSMNGVVTSHSIKVAGNTLDQALIRYLQTKYKLLIGERTAEKIKFELTNLYDPRENRTLFAKGRNLVSGMPEQVEISELDVFEAVEDEVTQIIEAIKKVLEETPPELVGDIYENGVLLAGGGALLGGLCKLIERTLKVKCIVAQDTLHCVAKGTAIAFRKVDKLLDGFEHIGVYQYQ